MKKRWIRLAALVLGLVMAFPAWAESGEAAITTETKGYRELQEEGTVISGEGYSIRISWCGTEGQRVFGRVYYPEGFDASRKYTTVVMNHGGGVNADFWDRYYAPELARAGYVCYAFDCRSATEGGRGSYGDPTPSGTCSVETYSEDLNAAMDFMLAQEYVDKEKFYIMGQSMGGASVQNVASRRGGDITGMIVLYGTVSEDNKAMLPDYEAVRANPYANGEVLFVQGAQDASLPIARTLDNMSWYEKCELVYSNKAYHGFGVQGDRPAQICAAHVIDFIERTSAE